MRTTRRVSLSAALVGLALLAGWGEQGAGRQGGADPFGRAAGLAAGHPESTRPASRAASRGERSSDAQTLWTDRERVVTEVAARTSRSAQVAARDDDREAERKQDEAEPRGDLSRLTLDRLLGVQVVDTVRATGFDRHAPRRIELWRVTDEASAVVAVGESDGDGEIHFPHLIVPRDGIRLVAAPEGEGPDSPSASVLREVPPRSPRPPRAWLAEGSSGEASLLIRPRETTGHIVLSDATGVEFARYPVRPGARALPLEVPLEPGEALAGVSLEHLLADGRRSEPVALTVQP